MRHWNKQHFAVGKLRLALQEGAISAMVRAPETGSLFRLPQSDWLFEPFWEQIFRGGVIPLHASRGLNTIAEERRSSKLLASKNGYPWKQMPGPRHRDWISFANGLSAK